VVLTYHSIAEGPPPLRVSGRRFEEQLDLLRSAGFSAVSLGTIVESFRQERPLPRPSFALTFDDGYRDFADVALPILERRRLPSTLFATASTDRDALSHGGGAPLLQLEDLGPLAARGVEIGAHSINHVDLTTLDDASLEQELREGQRILERHVGRPVVHFAYPLGCFNERVREVVARYYRSAVTTALATVGTDVDPFAIPRVDAHYLRSPLLRFLFKVRYPQPYLRIRRRLRRLRGTERGGGAAVPDRCGRFVVQGRFGAERRNGKQSRRLDRV
jgi:peptidoglycan/xylan/chitin deacetylase (PgdA/CDA1 family)